MSCMLAPIVVAFWLLEVRRSTGWIVIFVPDAWQLMHRGIYCTPSQTFEGMYDVPKQVGIGVSSFGLLSVEHICLRAHHGVYYPTRG